MIHALILSGGSGQRFGNNKPKQYLEIAAKPIIGYCIDAFQNNPEIDTITIVLAEEWKRYIDNYIHDNEITKFSSFAKSGCSRQHSILSGLESIYSTYANDDDLVIIHDAARPCVSDDIIHDCIITLKNFSMAMPVINVKDTVYYSENGMTISKLLNRDCLFAGQAPEGCHLGPYLDINRKMTDAELSATRGTCEAGFKYGLSVGMFNGDEGNYKITVPQDLEKFKMQIIGAANESI